MWFLRLAVVAVLCGLGALDIPDPPDYQKCANSLFAQMKVKLATEMRELNRTIGDVAGKVERLCGAEDNQQQIQVVQSSMAAEAPATAGDVASMKTGLERKLSDFHKDVKRIVQATAKKSDIVNGLSSNNDVLLDAIGTAMEQCTDDQLINEINTTLAQNHQLLLASLQDVLMVCGEQQDDADSQTENKKVLTAIQTAVGQCVTKQQVEESLASTNAELSVIKTAVELITSEAQAREERYMARIASLEEMLAEILNATRQQQQQLIQVPALGGTVYPCEDSTFPRNNYGVCESAVRFNKCYLETVAYHCCRTCTDNDKLPEMGSWRYRNDNREVNSLDVLRFFTL